MSGLSVFPQAQAVARHLDDAAGRYACYPGVAQFQPSFGDGGFTEALRASNGDPIPAKLSIHIGVPDHFGLYSAAGGRSELRRTEAAPGAYLHRLIRQIAAVGAICDRDRDVVQLGLSPGATDYFGADDIAEIVDSLSRNFHFLAKPNRDFSATVSQGALSRVYLRALVEAGCNRVGFAVGLDEEAQSIATAPVQAVALCREAGFGNVRIDVLFGASSENFDGFRARIAEVVRAVPDVVAMRDVAHLPESFAPGPGRAHSAKARADMLCHAWHTLHESGYVHFGMGVFVIPGDAWLRAKTERHLHRDALGFGFHGCTDLIGFGVGAIQQIGGAFCRGLPHLHDWDAAIDAGRFGIDTGLVLSRDDLIRASVIKSILCVDAVDFAAIADRYNLDVGAYFADALRALTVLADDGLLEFDERGLDYGFTLTPVGCLLSRVVASSFDVYLGPPAT